MRSKVGRKSCIIFVLSVVVLIRVSTTPGNPENLLEFKNPPGNPGNLLEICSVKFVDTLSTVKCGA